MCVSFSEKKGFFKKPFSTTFRKLLVLCFRLFWGVRTPHLPDLCDWATNCNNSLSLHIRFHLEVQELLGESEHEKTTNQMLNIFPVFFFFFVLLGFFTLFDIFFFSNFMMSNKFLFVFASFLCPWRIWPFLFLKK